MTIETAVAGQAIEYKPTIGQKILSAWRRLFPRQCPSRLLEHAQFEMRRAGLYDEDSDYGGMIPEAVMKMMRPFAAEGHSGFSAHLTLDIFNRLARFKVLTPITNDPAEWSDVSAFGGPKGKPIWQNRRDSSCFSNDGGITYYSVDDKERTVKTSAIAKAAA